MSRWKKPEAETYYRVDAIIDPVRLQVDVSNTIFSVLAVPDCVGATFMFSSRRAALRFCNVMRVEYGVNLRVHEHLVRKTTNADWN